MESDPRVLIVAATDDRIEALSQGLDALGWRTVSARTASAGAATLRDFPLDAAVVDLEAMEPDAIDHLRDAALPRSLAVIAVGPADAPAAAGADLIMRRAPHPAQAALRLEQLSRAAVAREEFSLRQATFAARDVDLSLEPKVETPLKILAAGAADRRFLALSNALTAEGAEVVAAPTPYTAFDYLHEAAFDAVVLWGGQDHAPALSIAAGMKRNTRLFHIPLALYLRSVGEVNPADLYNRGLADVAAADTSEQETADRVLSLARTHRRDQAVRIALDQVRASGLMDSATGLFTPEIFAAHLARLASAAQARRRPLSACVLRVAETEAVRAARTGGWLDRAMPQIGAMVSRLVRVEDTAARLAPEVFALALPATPGEAARLAAERIAAVIGCTAFDAGPDRSPFVVEFDIGAASLGDSDSAAVLLERASMNIRRSVR
ncbi:MAG: diguanylate cyclase [Brevundimonas sp.]|uniref:diguanylate cyclase domain-containing protein n=1 Tax=Brevundimonas sp. TaxID=1871086 RepID=UPI0025C48369|nr:diguanylate cyclase [Brevundimonas sp.]MBX3476570.1 diguanylate cyclase [Brevundimonas sp.]